MAKDNYQSIGKKLDVVIELLQRLLALELTKGGATQEAIGKHLHVAKATVVKMLQGIKKEE
jgi:predicted transcriptional regulator